MKHKTITYNNENACQKKINGNYDNCKLLLCRCFQVHADIKTNLVCGNGMQTCTINMNKIMLSPNETIQTAIQCEIITTN